MKVNIVTHFLLASRMARAPKGEFTKENGKGPKKVYCWQEGRDGGGWTLGLKSWYGQHHTFTTNGMRQTNNVNSGVMANMGKRHLCSPRPPL